MAMVWVIPGEIGTLGSSVKIIVADCWGAAPFVKLLGGTVVICVTRLVVQSATLPIVFGGHHPCMSGMLIQKLPGLSMTTRVGLNDN
jgi:hypothetical protein